MKPLVSVVIPTHRRPLLVKRAVQSALTQTLAQIEVIVVLDGPDETTHSSLAAIDDPRLRVIELPTNQGSCAARNAGIAVAQATWVAFLDDDDEWLPQKLQLQLEAVRHSQYALPIITCCVLVRMPKGDEVWPRRFPRQAEALSEYLFVRNTLFQGEGLIQTSTIFTANELLQKISFPTNLQRHEQRHDDWDWLLRAITLEGVGVEFVPEPLSIWYLGETRHSLSRSHGWQYSLSWIQAQRNLVTSRAYSSFVLAEVSSRAALDREWRVFWLLLWEAIRHGKPQLADICLYLGMWLVPPDTRRWLRILLTRERRALQT